MGTREFHDGAQDGLEALEPLDPDQIESFDDLLTAMRKTAFEGRRLGEAGRRKTRSAPGREAQALRGHLAPHREIHVYPYEESTYNLSVRRNSAFFIHNQ